MKQYIIKGSLEKPIVFSDKYEEPKFLNKKKLMDIKCEIDKLSNKEWERSKKMLNDFEYIYTSSKVNKNICGIVPVSRSYFKIYEILKDIIGIKDNGLTACIAEGPGGFIHCLNDYSNMKIYGITLISKNDKSIPFWNQQIINNQKNVLFSGEDKTGNIYILKNSNDFIKNIQNSCDLVTADGGFDYSSNYNEQEKSSYKLIYSEIYICLKVQKINGSFIIKFFDIFNYKTIQLIYLLYTCYEKVIIYKPTTSRLSNSEKYIVCSGYKGCNKEIIDKLEEYYDKCDKLIIDIPEYFIKEIMEYNNLFVNNQISIIEKIIKNTKNETVTTPSKNQINQATEWCKNYGLPINDKCIYI